MDRALDLQLLIDAVGSHSRLPEPDQLRDLLAATEVSLFTQQADIDERVLDTGWYLQAVATARADLGLYDLPRQRLAHQVSAHIFDLALQSDDDLTVSERLRLTFAAQVGYLGAELTPNAAALARRAPLPSDPYDWTDEGRVSLEAGVLVLALDRPALYPLLDARRAQLARFGLDLGNLTTTALAAVDSVIRGAFALTNYLTRGSPTQLELAQTNFEAAMRSEAASADIDSRWVAAHLLRISGELATTSVWAALPPDLSSAARAMTLGDPPVLSLWPPQLDFLSSAGDEPTPLDPDVRRLVLSFPTSAGKTLLAQILITAHLASAAEGDVCVVAPTHSLCRELGRSLDRRLRTLGDELYVEGPLGYDRPKPASARVAVMTPEKLAALLRSNPTELLAQYAMFVIDEAHLVADPSRGWRLEETLTVLHHLTLASDHRIVVLSAALGNQSHVITWMTGPDRNPVQHHTDWRGPRRLNAVYTNDPDWDAADEIPAEGRRLARRRIPLYGAIHLQTGNTTVHGKFTEPVGTLVRRQKRDGDWDRDNTTTTERARLVPLINHVAPSGPVLVVQPTRVEAQRLAEEMAATIDDDQVRAFALVDLARARLTATHPLAQMVGKGVAFHHAALPVDIQAEIENAVRAGHIQILIATSTLIEGVNLPFKTVIVGRRGYTDLDGQLVEAIDAPGLLNAVGRAGRAGRETEGWMILSEQSRPYSPALFDPLQQTGDDLDIRSTLATEEALAGLAAYDQAVRTTQDAIFQHYTSSSDGFLSFVWFVAQALQDLDQAEASIDEVLAVVKRTLAWHQLDLDQRELLGRVAEAAVDAFDDQDPTQRSRWARSGTSLPTAQTLDHVAETLLARLENEAELELSDLVAVLDFIVDDETLEVLLDVGENDRRGFKPYRTAPRHNYVDVDLKALLIDWVSGVEIQDLADRHLAAIDDEGFRSETLAEFSAAVFEHHLPWTLGIVIQWVNDRLRTAGIELTLPDELPAAVHYGVRTQVGLALMTGGVRSRRLANTVAADAATAMGDDEQRTLREWLADQTISDWRHRFDASPTEVADLLTFARTPGAQVVSSILEGAIHELAITPTATTMVEDTTEGILEPQPGEPEPAPIEVKTPDRVIGTIKSADHDEVALLIGMGIPLEIYVGPGPAAPVLTISLAPDAEA